MSERDSICASEEKPEVWRAIAGYEGAYEVSNLGRVRSLTRAVFTKYGTKAVRRGRVLKHGTSGGNGEYQLVILCVDKVRDPRHVHDLVLEAFAGPRPSGAQARHFPDPNPANNRADNLCWGTAKQNCADRVVHGTDPSGDRNPNVVIPDADVPRILELLKTGGREARFRIASEYGVHPNSLYHLRKRRST